MDAQHQTRSCIRARGEVSQTAPRGSRQICIPMDKVKYDAIWNEPTQVREYIDQTIVDYPELFPASISHGYTLRGQLPESQKLPGIRLRQIKTTSGAFALRPSFLFPYMMATTEELEKPLFLLSIGTPVWAVTRVFGRNDMFWQRHLERLGRNSLAGTTVRLPERMPLHLAADEHHLDWCGKKGYLAMTAAGGCTLGAALTEAADEPHLPIFVRESGTARASAIVRTTSAGPVPAEQLPALRSSQQLPPRISFTRPTTQPPNLPQKLAPKPPRVRFTSRIQTPNIESGSVS